MTSFVLVHDLSDPSQHDGSDPLGPSKIARIFNHLIKPKPAAFNMSIHMLISSGKRPLTFIVTTAFEDKDYSHHQRCCAERHLDSSHATLALTSSVAQLQ